MKKIYHLEGIRGVGALIVFVCHFQIVFMPEFYTRLHWWLVPHMRLGLVKFLVNFVNLMIVGNMFLHIFWALSAYVLFAKFFKYNTQNSALLSNSVKRYIRLMIPCAVSIFFSYIIFKAGFIYVRQIPVQTLQQNLYLIPPSFLHALKTSVWSTLFDYDYFSSYNGPLWTIQREFYGSVFCYALFGVIDKSNNRTWFYALIFACVWVLKIYWLNSFLFGYLLSDIDFSDRKDNSILARFIQNLDQYLTKHQGILLTLFTVIYVAGRVVIYRNLERMDWVNCILSFLLILISLRAQIVSELMKFKVFTSLGKLSFGLYVLHWPILCSLSSWLYLRFALKSYPKALCLMALSAAVCLAMAWLFNKLVDQHAIKLASKAANHIENLTKYKTKDQPRESLVREVALAK
ncbi:acyltransferase family protein [Mucilaginibacter sp. CSA2-8R]|uniref:acyltransferase family protein n=1 Tax=Mucilaginibacter sp. CSA2-8R TaxID=3141542 RepID=UPI00315DCACC